MLRMRRLTLIFLCGFLAQIIIAQQPDSLPAPRNPASNVALDTAVTLNKKLKMAPGANQVLVLPDSTAVSSKSTSFFQRYFVKKYPNPRTAALLSFILPGAGQAYNKKWWKIPIVYGALAGMTWLSIDNDREYQRLKKNYKLLVDGDDLTNPSEAPYTFMNANQMKGYRDQFRGYTEKSYLFLGITYLLAVTDAFVDAHLSQFDVSDDLTLRLVPDIQSASGGFGASFGVGIRLGFGRQTCYQYPRHQKYFYNAIMC